MDKLPKAYNKMSKKELKEKLLEIFNERECASAEIDKLIEKLKFLSYLMNG